MPLLIIIGLLALAAFWAVSTYNFFVSSKARIAAAIQEIGNQLKRQADLIPNLESAAKGYLKHEKGIFEALTDARKDVTAAVKSGNLQKMSDAGSKVAELLPQIRVAVESNPEIKGTEVVVPLMDELRDTADKVMYSRRLLIDLTADYNVKRVTFPSSIIANMVGVTEMKGMIMENEADANSVSASEMKTPKVSL
jgi:LemA protein